MLTFSGPKKERTERWKGVGCGFFEEDLGFSVFFLGGGGGFSALQTEVEIK